ncbi:MAG: sialidase [Saprospiraceae bacterium]|nr:MAG: sialidase [Saprospiraceae bacterium]
MRYTFAIFTCLMVLLGSCNNKTQMVHSNHSDDANTTVEHSADQVIKTYSPEYPVLIGKDNNPVFQINVQTSAVTAATDITTFKIDLTGTSELKDISAVSVFYNANKSDFSNKSLFGETTEISEMLSISGKQSLVNGDNYFWISLTLNETADILNKVACVSTEATINGKSIALSPPEKSTIKRLGHALRQHNDDGVDTYRIPGLATTNNGTLIAVYDIRYNSSVDLQEDVDIGMNRSTDGGQTWTKMEIIMDMGEWGGLPQDQNGIGDPSVLVDRQTNTIWVAAVWAHGQPGKRNWFASKQGMKPEETSQFVLVKSEDDGLTWSPPINITPQIKDPKWHLLLQGPGKGITMKDGTLVFPAQYKDEEEMPHSTLIYSKDHGKTWHIGTGAKSNTTEAQVVELADGSLMLNMRDNRGSGPDGRTGTGARSVAITTDLGKTWTEHETSFKALPEPVCMASLIKHTSKGQDLLLFSNPFDQYTRKNMTIKISEDEGMTWPEKDHTLIDEGRGRGYSCMTSIDENTIGILYEGSQADLIFQKIQLSVLKK